MPVPPRPVGQSSGRGGGGIKGGDSPGVLQKLPQLCPCKAPPGPAVLDDVRRGQPGVGARNETSLEFSCNLARLLADHP